MRAILDIDPDARTARVQPGVVLDDLRAAAQPQGLTFGPEPSTHNRCTLGGMIGNNAAARTRWPGARPSTTCTGSTCSPTAASGSRSAQARPPVRIPEELRDLGERYGATVRTAFPD
jgi:hypothetical protein